MPPVAGQLRDRPHSPPLAMHARVTEDEARAMLRAVLTLFDKWDVPREDRITLLGSPSDRTFQRWRNGEIGTLSVDTIYRLGDLLGIHKALRYMFTEPERGYAWVNRPNEVFAGATALDVMRQGAPADITRIRAYLDAERGAW